MRCLVQWSRTLFDEQLQPMFQHRNFANIKLGCLVTLGQKSRLDLVGNVIDRLLALGQLSLEGFA